MDKAASNFTIQSRVELDHYNNLIYGPGKWREQELPIGSPVGLDQRGLEAMEACRRLEAARYREYRALRLECGYSADHGYLHEKVWWGMEREAQVSAVRQMQAGADEVAARKAEMPQGWGDW